jgi:ABC-type branched-subunit amino acid transport system ATPase component
MGQVRTFQLTKSLGLLTVLENMLLGAKHQPGERLFTGLIPGLWKKQEAENTTRARDLLKRFKLDAKEVKSRWVVFFRFLISWWVRRSGSVGSWGSR